MFNNPTEPRGYNLSIMGTELRELMELWLRLSGGNFNPTDEERFFHFVFETVKQGVFIEQNLYEEIVESCKSHNANLNEEYLSRHDFNHFESYCEFGKYILNKLG